MLKKILTLSSLIVAAASLPVNSAIAADGMITVKSPHDVATTVEKLVAVLESKGMNAFGRVNHGAGAKKAGLELRPTELVLFGNCLLYTSDAADE